eukprot:TRINITY_DN10894_c0_g1_i2.p1 TRINITY_DN10894_c0_g1~~TRINITY_DN10894_c0_g1_i2.p1  ORF type:complete len:579 (-),score=58.54 TRINITY_DN10894_c0_g1_i2:451-2187(-)
MGAVDPQRGVGFEVWTAWGTWNCLGGLQEILLSLYLRRDMMLPLKVYPKAMAATMLPLVSERVDTAKDIVVCAVACSLDDYICAVLNFTVLLCAHAYFMWNAETRGELLDNYCPILTAIPEEQSDDTTALAQSSGVPQEDATWISRMWDMAISNSKFQDFCLKQTAPARLRISLCEDLPQAVISTYLGFRYEFGIFCVLTLLTSVARGVLASPWVSGPVRNQFLPRLREARRDAIHTGNGDMALALTQQILAVQGEVPELLLPADTKALLEVIQQDENQTISHSALVRAGFACRDMKAAGFDALKLTQAGFSFAQMKDAGFGPRELSRAATSATLALRELPFTGAELKAAGFSARELCDGSYKLEDVVAAGFSAEEIARDCFCVAELMAHWTASDMKAAKLQDHQLKELGRAIGRHDSEYTVPKLRAAGFDVRELTIVGFGATALKEGGFTAVDMKAVGGIAGLKDAGYLPAELKHAGFDAAELQKGGFYEDDLADLKQAGFKAAELKDTCSVLALKNVGYQLKELAMAGCPVDELRKAGFDAKQFKAAGLGPQALERAGFTLTKTKNAFGFTKEEWH